MMKCSKLFLNSNHFKKGKALALAFPQNKNLTRILHFFDYLYLSSSYFYIFGQHQISILLDTTSTVILIKVFLS